MRYENEHSFSRCDPALIPLHQTEPAPDQRRTRILDAAERCFAIGGFHRTTMADIAREAGMSAGNLYRYFLSKDAVVSKLCERDRAGLTTDFMALKDIDDPFEAFRQMGRKHLVEEPRSRAVLVAEIWAEAGRNPAICNICTAFEQEISLQLQGFLHILVARGLMRADVDIRSLAAMLNAMIDGVIVQRARQPGFDPEPFIARIMELIKAAGQGAIPGLLLSDSTDGNSP
jgi:TetR/AcrR family transcriptional regulator, repressor for uid operon